MYPITQPPITPPEFLSLETKQNFRHVLIAMFDQIDFVNESSPNYLSITADEVNYLPLSDVRIAFERMLIHAERGFYDAFDRKIDLSPLADNLEKISLIFSQRRKEFDFWGPYVKVLAVGSTWSMARWNAEAVQLLQILELP